MTNKDDKYAVVVDGDIVDTAPTKKAAKEVLETVPDTAETEVREFDPEKDTVVRRPSGIQHVR